MASRLLNLRQKKSALVIDGGEILGKAEKQENGALTADQIARLDVIDVECARLSDLIGREERQADLERSQGAALFKVDSAAVGVADAPRFPRPFRSFGEQLQAIMRSSGAGATPDPRLIVIQDAYRQAMQAATPTGSGENVPADGGYLVQQDFAATIREGIMAGSQILPRLFRVPITTGVNGIKIPAVNETSRVDGSRWGGIRAYWAAEADAATKSKPAFRQIKLDLKKLIALWYATDELLADAGALEMVGRRGFTEEMIFKAEDAVVNGNGAGQPLGILNGGGTVSVAKETGQAATTIVYQNIIKMWSRLPARSRPNAVWLVNQDAEPQLDQMFLAVGTGGVPVYMPANGVADTPFGRLRGRPVIPVEYCATLGTVGDILLVDLTEYLWIEKSAPDWQSSMHVQFTTDEMTFRMVWRVDGQPSLVTALTPYKGTATQSPFVSLATRA